MARRRGGHHEAELHADALRLLAEADYPSPVKQVILMALRGGKPAAELAKIYFDQCGVGPEKDTVVYCRIGERSSHTWFVLTYLLGLENVRNYDGSWTEWGNKVGAPIEKSA